TQVAALTLKLEGLEEVLAGVTHGELTGALSTLDGIDNGELTGALAKLNGISGQNLDDLVSQLPTLEGVPALQGNVTQLGGEVETICQQTNSVNDQVGAVGDVVNNLLSGLDAIPLVGDVLGGETVTGGVSNLTC
ncbi:MAG TPA: hypothetical protein VG518_00465, partial [Solirubrobacterales bacterium]|nr:hypothetical protein [Solirubrobacterales bacterium]